MNSKDRIISAAIRIFSEKGKYGAGMDEIAKRAKINKAMLYYYFSNKENLYKESLRTILCDIHASIVDIYHSAKEATDDPVANLRRLAIAHMEAFSEYPEYVRMFHEAIINQPELVHRLMSEAHLAEGDCHSSMHSLVEVLQQGIDKGMFRSVDCKQVLISIIGMNLIFFIGKPIGQAMLNLSITDEKTFLEERKKSIIDLLLNGLLKKQEPSR
jgi:TetR/AcrR family transcriptional regulator